VAKRQTRLAGLDDKILWLYAGGMSVRDIETHLQTLYGVQIGRDTISRVTDRVLEDIAAWRVRPLEALYLIVYFDALMVKMTEDRSVKTRACYLAVGLTLEGERELLGLWWQDKEGAKFWLTVLNDLRHRVTCAWSTPPPMPRTRSIIVQHRHASLPAVATIAICTPRRARTRSKNARNGPGVRAAVNAASTSIPRACARPCLVILP